MAEKKAKKEEQLVSVEMTESQKDEVVGILSAKKDEEASKGKMSIIDLRFAHRRNGNLYGPGVITVQSEIAGSLIAADHKAFEARIKETQANNHNLEILSAGRARVISEGV